MKGLLFFDIYSAVLPLVDPYTRNKLTSLTKKLHRFSCNSFGDSASASAYFGLLVPTLFFLGKVDTTIIEPVSGKIYLFDRDKLDITIQTASMGGQISLCQTLLDLSYRYPKHYDVINYSLLHAVEVINYSFAHAAEVGHMKLCTMLIQRYGATTFNATLERAAKYGQIDMCKMLVKLGANNFDGAGKR